MASDGDRVQYWKDRWDTGRTGFHKSEVHQMLTTHFDKLFSTANKERIFVPLCGKTLDMKWLYDKNIPVVGLDAVKVSLEQFFSEQALQSSVDKLPSLGDEAELIKSSDDKIRLYCADLFKFNKDVEGTFEAVWDRGSLVAINRQDVQDYVKLIKSLLKPGGRCLLETFEYNLKDLEGSGHPPPHPVPETEVRQLYEPDCKVELLQTNEAQLSGNDAKTLVFLITKC